MNLPFVQHVFMEFLLATLMLKISTCSRLRLLVRLPSTGLSWIVFLPRISKTFMQRASTL